MKPESQRPKEREHTISTSNTAIEAIGLAKEISSIAPAKVVFGSVVVVVVLTTIRVSFPPVFVDQL